MSYGYNRVTLLGNLGADPELRFTGGGTAVLNLRMATTESYLDRDKQRKERTEWHSVTVWGKRAEALGKILTKGSSILVEGSLHTSSYEKEGTKRYKTEINANNVILTGGRGDRTAQSSSETGLRPTSPASPSEPYGGNDSEPYGGSDDDIPF